MKLRATQFMITNNPDVDFSSVESLTFKDNKDLHTWITENFGSSFLTAGRQNHGVDIKYFRVV